MTEYRSHRQIVADAYEGGTKTALSQRLGPDVTRQNVVDWERRDFIPAERWMRFVDLGVTTYEELAAHVAAHKAAAA